MFINAKTRTTKTQHKENPRRVRRRACPRQATASAPAAVSAQGLSLLPRVLGVPLATLPLSLRGVKAAAGLRPQRPLLPTGTVNRLSAAQPGRPRSPPPTARARFARPGTDTALQVLMICVNILPEWIRHLLCARPGLVSGRRGENHPRRVAPRSGRLRSGAGDGPAGRWRLDLYPDVGRGREGRFRAEGGAQTPRSKPGPHGRPSIPARVCGGRVGQLAGCARTSLCRSHFPAARSAHAHAHAQTDGLLW